MKKLVIILIFLIVLVLIFIKYENNNKDILEIANSNDEIKSYIQNREYKVEISKVNKEDINKLPAIYKDINAEYKVLYDLKEFKLLVLIEDGRVVKIVPISAVYI